MPLALAWDEGHLIGQPGPVTYRELCHYLPSSLSFWDTSNRNLASISLSVTKGSKWLNEQVRVGRRVWGEARARIRSQPSGAQAL